MNLAKLPHVHLGSESFYSSKTTNKACNKLDDGSCDGECVCMATIADNCNQCLAKFGEVTLLVDASAAMIQSSPAARRIELAGAMIESAIPFGQNTKVTVTF